MRNADYCLQSPSGEHEWQWGATRYSIINGAGKVVRHPQVRGGGALKKECRWCGIVVRVRLEVA